MVDKSLFSSNSEEWATPQTFFDKVNDIFDLELDVCATDDNHKCKIWYTKEQDALTKNWGARRCWMNPPYGREIGRWMKKAYEESLKGSVVICLVPVRPDTKWWRDWVHNKGEITFIKGRLKFGGSPSNAPFPSAVIVYGMNLDKIING